MRNPRTTRSRAVVSLFEGLFADEEAADRGSDADEPDRPSRGQ